MKPYSVKIFFAYQSLGTGSWGQRVGWAVMQRWQKIWQNKPMGTLKKLERSTAHTREGYTVYWLDTANLGFVEECQVTWNPFGVFQKMLRPMTKMFPRSLEMKCWPWKRMTSLAENQGCLSLFSLWNMVVGASHWVFFGFWFEYLSNPLSHRVFGGRPTGVQVVDSSLCHVLSIFRRISFYLFYLEQVFHFCFTNTRS